MAAADGDVQRRLLRRGDRIDLAALLESESQELGGTMHREPMHGRHAILVRHLERRLRVEHQILHGGQGTNLAGNEQWCAKRGVLRVNVGAFLDEVSDALVTLVACGHVTRQVQWRLVFCTNRCD